MKTIGIITSDPRYTIPQGIIAGIREGLDDKYNLLLDVIDEQTRMQLDVDAVAGVLVLSDALSLDDLTVLYETGKPILLVEHQSPDVSMPAIAQNLDSALIQVVDYVVNTCGRREIVFVHGADDSQIALFRRELSQRNLVCLDTHILTGNGDPVTASNAVIEFFDQGLSFDAVVIADYMMGVAVLDLLHLFEIEIPEKVSVVALGDGADAFAIGLTAVGVDIVEIGRQSARHLLKQIAGESVDALTLLEPQFVIRDS